MSKPDIIRPWKDAEYRNSLSKEQQAQLPESPIGEVELSLDDLDQVAGAGGTYSMLTAGCCQCSCLCYTRITITTTTVF